MTSLRDQLEGKQRRRLVQPVQVSDPSADTQLLNGVLAAYQLEQQRPAGEQDAAKLAHLQTQLEEAGARVRAHYVEVELQSMPPADWNAAMHEWHSDTDVINWAEALGPLLAASCVDADLQDAEWWTAQLGKDTWSDGDVNSLRMAVLYLNAEGLDARYPKD